MLLGVGFVVFMGVFIKCCAVHTPSSNPRKPPARSITETLRRPVNTLRRVKVRVASCTEAEREKERGKESLRKEREREGEFKKGSEGKGALSCTEAERRRV